MMVDTGSTVSLIRRSLLKPEIIINASEKIVFTTLSGSSQSLGTTTIHVNLGRKIYFMKLHVVKSTPPEVDAILGMDYLRFANINVDNSTMTFTNKGLKENNTNSILQPEFVAQSAEKRPKEKTKRSLIKKEESKAGIKSSKKFSLQDEDKDHIRKIIESQADSKMKVFLTSHTDVLQETPTKAKIENETKTDLIQQPQEIITQSAKKRPQEPVKSSPTNTEGDEEKTNSFQKAIHIVHILWFV